MKAVQQNYSVFIFLPTLPFVFHLISFMVYSDAKYPWPPGKRPANAGTLCPRSLVLFFSKLILLKPLDFILYIMITFEEKKNYSVGILRREHCNLM